MQHLFEMFSSATVVSVVGLKAWRRIYSPLRSAAPPLMILATITAPVASSRLMVAPWSTRKASGGQESAGATASLAAPVLLTSGSLFFTSRTIFTDSSSSSSSRSSGSGGSTGSKFF